MPLPRTILTGWFWPGVPSPNEATHSFLTPLAPFPLEEWLHGEHAQAPCVRSASGLCPLKQRLPDSIASASISYDRYHSAFPLDAAGNPLPVIHLPLTQPRYSAPGEAPETVAPDGRFHILRGYAVASSVMVGCLRYRRMASRMRPALAA